jgi:ABC-type Fe3+-siderophore transport system permease subunit
MGIILMPRRKKYIFTDKKTSERAIMSTILGIISNASLGIVIYKTYRQAGETQHGYGITAILAMIFSVIGLILGIITVRDKEYYRLFPVLGILLNAIALGIVVLILQLAQGI